LGLAGFRRGGGSDLVGPAFAMVGVLGFAFKAILIKLAYASTSIDAVTLLTLRMAYSAPFFALMAWWSTRAPAAKPLTRRDWLSIAWLGFIGYYLSSLVDFIGLQYVTAALERLMLYLYPTIVVVGLATWHACASAGAAAWSKTLLFCWLPLFWPFDFRALHSLVKCLPSP